MFKKTIQLICAFEKKYGTIHFMYKSDAPATLKKEKKQRFSTRDIVHIAVFAALLCVLAQIAVPTPWGIPFTLQTLGIMLSAVILGWAKGSIAVFIYVIMGAVGLPVFAGLNGGFGVIMGPTGGFILGFVPAAMFIGLLSVNPPAVKKTKSYCARLVAGITVGLIIIYSIGTVWFMYLTNSTITAALSMATLPFLLPEIPKAVIAIIGGVKISVKQ